MSFMVPFWPHTEPGSAPILVCEHPEGMLVKRMLFIAFMVAAQVSPNVFGSQGGFSQHTSEHYIIFRLHTHIHLCYRSHGIHFIYITFMHSVYTFFFFTSLLIFLAGWLPLILEVRYTLQCGVQVNTMWSRSLGGNINFCHLGKNMKRGKGKRGNCEGKMRKNKG